MSFSTLKFRVLSAMVGMLLAVMVSETQAQRVLRWKLQPGQAINVSFVQDMDMESNVMGKAIKSSADMAMVMNWQVQRVGQDGSAEMKQSISRLKMTMQTPGSQPVSYDSASPNPPEGLAKNLAGSIEPLVGVEFVQKMTDRGEIVDVRLSDKSAERLKQAPESAQMQQLFSKDGLKSLLKQAATVLPEGPLKPGDQWTGTSTAQSPVGRLVMNNTYTYRGVENVKGQMLDRIDVNVKVDFQESQNKLGFTVAVKGQQNQGKMYFDANEGRFAETTLNQMMILETTVGKQVHTQKLNTLMRMRFTPAVATNQRVQSTAGRKPVTARTVSR